MHNFISSGNFLQRVFGSLAKGAFLSVGVFLAASCEDNAAPALDQEIIIGPTIREMPLTGGEGTFTMPIHEVSDRMLYKNRVFRHFFNREFEVLEDMASDARDNDRRTPAGVPVLDFFYEALDHHAFVTEDGFTEQFNELITAWFAKFPDSTTAHLVAAQNLKNIAWKRRGGAYAHETTAGQFAGMHAGLLEVEQYLLERRAILEKDPQYFNLRLHIALHAKSATERNLVVEEALDNFPAYHPIYQSLAHSFTPKWGGSIQRIEMLAEEAVRRNPQEGRRYYALVYWAAQYWDKRVQNWLATGENWPKLRAAFYDQVKYYPDTHNVYNFLGFSCLARDHETARKIYNAIEEQAPNPNLWNEQNVFFCKESGFAGRMDAEKMKSAAADIRH